MGVDFRYSNQTYQGEPYKIGSNIHAHPQLQYPRKDVIKEITAEVTSVIEVKNASYTPSSDTETGIYVGLIGVAAAIAGIVLCSLATAAMVSGFGAAAIVVGAVVTLLAMKLLKKAREKAGNEVAVKDVFDSAMEHKIGATIKKYQDRDDRDRGSEGVGDRRGDYRRDDRDAFGPDRVSRRRVDDESWTNIA